MSRTLEHFNYLHQIPELGFEEYKTSAYIGDALEAAGFQVQRNVGGTTGIVALLDSGKPGPVVALRADMDALGHMIDGRLEARHTCGHDGHSSVVLTAAEEILAEGLVKRGKLKILFQPAEELGTGAIALTEAGVLDDVEMLFGFHLRPLEECPKGKAAPAMYYSASATVMADFHGKAAHAARPHLGVNALDAASHAVQAVNGIHLAPSLTWSAKATRFLCDAGVTNSVPAKAHVCWDLRSAENDGMAMLKERVVRAIESSAAAYGATVDIQIVKEMPAAIIDEQATAIVSQAIRETFGEAGLTAAKSTPGSEDFFHYLRLRPQVKGGFWGWAATCCRGCIIRRCTSIAPRWRMACGCLNPAFASCWDERINPDLALVSRRAVPGIQTVIALAVRRRAMIHALVTPAAETEPAADNHPRPRETELPSGRGESTSALRPAHSSDKCKARSRRAAGAECPSPGRSCPPPAGLCAFAPPPPLSEIKTDIPSPAAPLT